MAQAKRKTATKTAKKCPARKSCASRGGCAKKQQRQQEQNPNMFFVVSMSFLAATLLFADLLMMTA